MTTIQIHLHTYCSYLGNYRAMSFLRAERSILFKYLSISFEYDNLFLSIQTCTLKMKFPLQNWIMSSLIIRSVTFFNVKPHSHLRIFLRKALCQVLRKCLRTNCFAHICVFLYVRVYVEL